MGPSGAAVTSFREQIPFPAAKDMLGLNKNGNSQQIELGTGKVAAASPLKLLQCPWGTWWCWRRQRAALKDGGFGK